MRRALAVASCCLLAVLLLGLVRARTDTLREMEGSLDLAKASQVLAGLRDAPVEEGLGRLRAMAGLRHLSLSLRDEAGAVVATVADEDSEAWLTQKWRAAFASLGVNRAVREIAYGVPLRDGRVWTAVLTASPDSEILESVSNLVGLFVVMLACGAAMLAAMHWSVRRSLRPLATLVEAIGGVERHDLALVKSLPKMPLGELEAIAQALRHLVAAQERSEAGRRVLTDRLMSLQEDERQRLAGDLHDEFGQRLTALRVDASWLQRADPLAPPRQRVIDGMVEQIALIQRDVRRLLARLRPFGAASGVGASQTCARLRSMLLDLVAGWSATGGERGLRIELRMDEQCDAQPLPHELALGLYRITQEALTNVVRHAGAASCCIEVTVRRESARRVVTWRVADDGRGIADLDAALRRGTGLAGIKDRIWALGGSFDATRGIGNAGLALQAEFCVAPDAEGA